MSNDKKGAVVTGAARGIGRQIATALLEDGYGVVIADVDPAVGEQTVKELSKAHAGRVVFSKVDVTKRAEVQAAIAACRKAFGELTVMVNNAGFNKPEPFLEATEKTWHAIMDVNALGVLIGIQEAAKTMIEHGIKGKIINTASLLSFQGGIRVVSYTAAKSALMGVTRAMANELAPLGINVNAIAPGYFETDNTAALRADAARSRAILERIPAGRWGEPADLQGAVVFLASRAADYVHGIKLPVDGGWLAR